MSRRELKGRWLNLARRIGVYLADPVQEFRRLVRLYQKPARAYHNLDHIAFCLAEFERVNHRAVRPNAVELAIWFHDAVYDPKSSKNEEKSSYEAALFCDRAGVLQEVKKSACEIIVASKHLEGPRGTDEGIFTDVDLAILGQPGKVFWPYEEAIAREYAWVPKPVFSEKRAEILRRFLDRPSIYTTGEFQKLYETRARQNLEASISKLRRNGNGQGAQTGGKKGGA